MDLLSPCRSCLQCLPFFHVSPPSSPLTSSSISQEALKGTDPLHSTESLPYPDTVHATQAQGVCPPSIEEEEKAHHEIGHGHDLSHHGHDRLHHGHDHSHHHLEDHGPEHSHLHASPYSESPLSEQSLDISKGSDELCKGDDLFQHAPHHDHDSAVALHGAANIMWRVPFQHHHVEGAIPTSSLDTSSSTPELDMEAKGYGENSAVSPTNVGLAQMESYHSEPIGLFEALGDDDPKASHNEVLEHSASARRRRREYLKDQLKGIKQQIKQGGLHIKEEGGKHVQIIMENVSKHAQQIEGSGSFSRVLRTNKN